MEFYREPRAKTFGFVTLEKSEMTLRFTFFLLLAIVSASAQVQKVGYDPQRDLTMLYFSVKGIDTVKIPGNWERDKRDLATSVYLKSADNSIGFYIDTKNKAYAAAGSEAESLKRFVSDKTKKFSRSGWDFELLGTDSETYQLYKIKNLRHPDANQVALLGSRGRFTYNIVCYGTMGDNLKADFLIRLFQNTLP